ncbi:MAG: hypothetical protein V6D39_12265 [Dolichospermum lemmermannii FEM_B0920]
MNKLVSCQLSVVSCQLSVVIGTLPFLPSSFFFLLIAKRGVSHTPELLNSFFLVF